MAGPGAKRPTLRDVAREAAVSYQTVSRVINESPNVSDKTRTRVLRIMREMNYRPNRAAQMLATRRSFTLEIVATDLLLYPASMLAAITNTARQSGYGISITSLPDAELDGILESIPARLRDGFILVTPRSQSTYEELNQRSNGVPFVVVGGQVDSNMPSVVYDQYEGTRQAVQHLVDLGHRRIGAIHGNMAQFDAQARRQAWQATLADNHLHFGPAAYGHFTPESGFAAANELLDSGEPFTALFVANDAMAISTLYALRLRGLRIPQDVSVVGFDNQSFVAYLDPPLTTINQDPEKMGNLAAAYLIARIENPDTPVHQHILVPELVIRESTCPPRS